MVAKVIGSIAVLTACSGFGFYCAGEMTRRLKQLRELSEAILLLKGDIRYLRSSLPEAFAAAAVRTGAFAEFFRSVARQLGGFCTASVEEAFSIASKGCLKDTALTKQDISMLVKLGGMLGKMDADMQLNALEWYLEQLEGLTDTLDRENKKRALLSKSLGILAGIFLLVILL